MSDAPDKPSLPITDGCVPVYDCHVLLRHTDAGVEGRTANLDGITANGPTERDVLLAITKKFKATVQGYVAVNEDIPFRTEPHKPEEGEVERWIPVHL